MAFEWFRMHKYEENIERDICDTVHDYVSEFYNSAPEDLTLKQIQELQEFVDENVSEYNVLYHGFQQVFNSWETENATE